MACCVRRPSVVDGIWISHGALIMSIPRGTVLSRVSEVPDG